ncbi:SpaA isopeptide-forming pilin-related protein [Bifidobacterium sp. SO1]|uniref:SpaA isopeptide-forming pilin-related protein n=1 Tax=Bifidobacterium sp. SO1 TaxID=2809029 RepID=UPI001BDC2219|nr:SpaA isopeptide-forming pilin-related protein [Bifidobacterium sp. SO1]MBT1162751.1 hypothetical protein [Bifidobacterium sp. SO1]
MDSKKSVLLRGLTATAVSLAMLGAFAMAGTTANAADDYTITIHAASADRGGSYTLAGRKFTAYKLADYVDGTYVSIGSQDKAAGQKLDGVSVDTPTAIRADLNRVLAKTTGVTDVTKLPGWAESGKDPISWMGGFKQDKKDATHTGNNQASGSFGFGWNESGPQGNGNISPDKAYTGSVREFADNLVKDAAALAKVKTQPSVSVDCKVADTCVVPLTATQGSGIYLILDSGSTTEWKKGEVTYTTGTTQPMIVPTKADTADLATVDGYKPSDPANLGTTGKLGEITVKNVADQEVLPTNPPNGDQDNPPSPKQRDENQTTGKDASDNASDLGDTIPYVVNYRVPDLSAYRNAKDNGRAWTYLYRIIDNTANGLKITGTPTVKLYPAGVTLYDANGKALPEDKIVDSKGQKVTPTVITPTQETTEPAMPTSDAQASATGQTTETHDAWYSLTNDANDHSRLVIGLGKWLVNNYGDLALNDKTKTLYGSQIQIRYNATVTSKILANGNKTNNANWLNYSDKPSDVTSASSHDTPHVTVKQWTYDIDLHKRSSTSTNVGLEDAKFTLTVKDNKNTADAKKNGTVLKFVSASQTKGDYRLAVTGETGSTELVTGKDGLLRLRGLDLGTYTLTETEPPTHYQKLTQSEDVTISAVFEDTPGDYVIPNYQTELKYTISQNNRIPVWNQPMFNFATVANKAPAGLTINGNTATWGQKDQSGKWYADDKTNVVASDLTLWNRPINVMLAKTGGYVGITMISIVGTLLVLIGAASMIRKRHDTKPENDLFAGLAK